MHAALLMEPDPTATAPSASSEPMALLVARIASDRDREAFRQLYCHYGPRVKGLMLRKGARPELAEELMQETMLAVWTKASLFHPGRGSVATWIFTIARNLRIDRLRRESIQHFEDVHELEIAEGDLPDRGEVLAQDEAAIARQEQRRVAEALRTLPGEQADILRLSFVDELSQSDIAQRLSLPLGTVKSRMRLAYRRLRLVLEDRP